MIRIEDRESRFGIVSILRAKKTGTLIYSQGGSFQSEADLKGVSLAAYVHALFDLVVQAKSKKVLMIGCGGGTLGTMLSRAGLRVTIVDINPTAFDLAHRYFSLPDSVVGHVADGCEFLLANNYLYDAIVLDAFQGDRIPGHLRSLAFFRFARRRLNTSGSIFVNVHIEHDNDDSADCTAECMSNVWSDVRLLDAPGQRNRNAIVMAGAVKTLYRPNITMPPEVGAHEIALELGTLRFRDYQSGR